MKSFFFFLIDFAMLSSNVKISLSQNGKCTVLHDGRSNSCSSGEVENISLGL